MNPGTAIFFDNVSARGAARDKAEAVTRSKLWNLTNGSGPTVRHVDIEGEFTTVGVSGLKDSCAVLIVNLLKGQTTLVPIDYLTVVKKGVCVACYHQLPDHRMDCHLANDGAEEMN